MKIVLVGTGTLPIPPQKGGAVEKIIYELAKFISNYHKVYVIDFKNKSENINKIIVKHKPIRCKFLSILSEFLFGLKSMKILKSLNPDIVHVQTVFTALALALFNIKYIYTCHNPVWTTHKIDMLNKIVKFIEAFVIKRAFLVIVLSKDMEKQVKKVNKRVVKITNFVDLCEFKITEKRKNTVLFVGKLTKNKGIDVFLNAVKIILKKRRDIRFFVIGSESFLKNDVRKWVKYATKLGIYKHVKFYGLVSRNKLKKLYSISEVFCLPTKREVGMCLVVLEALASGCKIVVTNVSGMNEIINKKNGIIISSSPESVACGIIKMLNTNLKPLQIRNSIIHLDKHEILRKYLFIYENLKKAYIS